MKKKKENVKIRRKDYTKELYKKFMLQRRFMLQSIYAEMLKIRSIEVNINY